MACCLFSVPFMESKCIKHTTTQNVVTYPTLYKCSLSDKINSVNHIPDLLIFELKNYIFKVYNVYYYKESVLIT